MKRRTTELLLLLAASPVIILIFVLALINAKEPVTLTTLAVPLGLFAAFLAAHLAVRRFAPNADAALLPIVFMLSGIGIAFVMRLAPSLAGRQVLWLFLGVAAMIVTVALVRSVKTLGNYKYTLMIIGIILLILPAIIGSEINGSRIWLSFAGFSFQPGELAKICIVLFLAGYLADNREMLSAAKRRVLGIDFPDLRTLAPLLIMWALSMLIVVFEKDLGSALLFFGIFLLMIYVATGRRSYVISGLVLALIGGTAAYFLFSHVQDRVAIWFDPWSDAPNTGYQLIQALFSLADGNLVGTGIGRGMPDYIPVVASDFIFVAMAEEMGLLGAAAILLLFVLFAVRGLSIAARARSDVDAFTAVGLTAAISLQAFVIVGGVTQFIPLTGVTLPFMSQGGSSLLASFVIVGLLLRAGDDGTGIETDIQATTGFGVDGGVLGRVALGHRLTLLITGFCCLFALLIGNLTWHMIIDAPRVRDLADNNHTLEHSMNIQRGAILTADDVILAQSERDAEGNWRRTYPQGTLAAHTVGYMTSSFGASGLESTYAETLAGRSDFSSWRTAFEALAGSDTPGNSIYTTLDSRIQQSSEAALSGYQGAAVVLNAQTGAVLASASAPSYDINTITELLSNAGDKGGGPGSGTSELFNRATQALYAPGSTFKTVTLTAALSGGGMTLDTSVDAPGSIEIGSAAITNFDGYSYGTVSLLKAYEVSSNTAFAQVADDLGATALVQTATNFGFNLAIDTDFALVPSLMPEPNEMTTWETAWAGVGQPVGEHDSAAGPQATVLEMALVSCAIANDGTIMRPYLMDRVVSPEGLIVTSTTPERLGEACTPEVAREIERAMAGVISEGTGTAAQIPGYAVYGKTGTAQTANAEDNSWFIGYIEIDGQAYVVAIVLEQAPGGTATPAARSIFQTLTEVYG
ncbi:MAG: FtsW/RodA/SpoVE family cell cycle protein [Coriobacteriales bacterium]|jgi:peptidoglycan glycosyltransferase|nr:FtsW/RodA/SpoVE family cell cycle protein [Coriobacteriales bacterium]